MALFVLACGLLFWLIDAYVCDTEVSFDTKEVAPWMNVWRYDLQVNDTYVYPAEVSSVLKELAAGYYYESYDNFKQGKYDGIET